MRSPVLLRLQVPIKPVVVKPKLASVLLLKVVVETIGAPDVVLVEKKGVPCPTRFVLTEPVKASAVTVVPVTLYNPFEPTSVIAYLLRKVFPAPVHMSEMLLSIPGAAHVLAPVDDESVKEPLVEITTSFPDSKMLYVRTALASPGLRATAVAAAAAPRASFGQQALKAAKSVTSSGDAYLPPPSPSSRRPWGNRCVHYPQLGVGPLVNVCEH
jgi:hypothetical protein